MNNVVMGRSPTRKSLVNKSANRNSKSTRVQVVNDFSDDGKSENSSIK